jgi:hypothetical protein
MPGAGHRGASPALGRAHKARRDLLGATLQIQLDANVCANKLIFPMFLGTPELRN